MKAIINGKRYDTETAELVASDSYSTPNDFHYWSEDLYRTPRGNWFLVGEGGPMSKYSRSAGNNTTTGASGNFRVLSNTEAFEWLQEAEASKTLEKYFGDEIEDA